MRERVASQLMPLVENRPQVVGSEDAAGRRVLTGKTERRIVRPGETEPIENRATRPKRRQWKIVEGE